MCSFATGAHNHSGRVCRLVSIPMLQTLATSTGRSLLQFPQILSIMCLPPKRNRSNHGLPRILLQNVLRLPRTPRLLTELTRQQKAQP